jgi:hypothetical protein
LWEEYLIDYLLNYDLETVLRDIDPPGIDFRKYTNSALLNTHILLTVVGPNSTGRTSGGRTRITETDDPVRVEIEAALRKDIPVIPVLVVNATMPLQNELPEKLQYFSYRNAIKPEALEDFDDHVRPLMRSLDRLPQSIG